MCVRSRRPAPRRRCQAQRPPPSPSWPNSLSPQHLAPPESVIAQVCWSPAAIFVACSGGGEADVRLLPDPANVDAATVTTIRQTPERTAGGCRLAPGVPIRRLSYRRGVELRGPDVRRVVDAAYGIGQSERRDAFPIGLLERLREL